MKKLSLRFERDETLSDIEIVVRASEETAQVKEIIESLTRRDDMKLTLLDKNGNFRVVDEKDIVFLSADGKQVIITAKSGVYRAKQSLQNIEQIMSRDFLRVSRFELVNLKMVSKYDFTIGGTLRIEFKNGMETWASRRYIPQIKQRLSGKEGYLC
ncbi:MAG: LytTR family transcriptional regulator DNA-binding domain-containing protein [Ruminococcus sp.]|nr:LytTR family transcriptional regulator DNA-binding domain-containing protein [Ruminococcus sp.]